MSWGERLEEWQKLWGRGERSFLMGLGWRGQGVEVLVVEVEEEDGGEEVEVEGLERRWWGKGGEEEEGAR